MKIAMIGWEYPPFKVGGLGTHCYGLTRSITDKNIHLDFYMPKTSHNTKSDKSNLKIIEVGEVNLFPYDKPTMKEFSGNFFDAVQIYNNLVVSKVEENIKKYGKYDAIHCHDWLTMKAGIAVKDKFDIPLVLTIHSTEYDRAGWIYPNQWFIDIEKQGMEKADKIIAVSYYTKRIIVEKYNINPKKIQVIYNAVFPIGEGKKQKIVLFLGRLTIQKGPEFFLQAAKKILDYEPNTSFVVAGNGDMLPKLIDESINLGISNKVIFTGILTEEEVKHIYSISSVYLMPSISEPFGITALEAVSAGTPTIVSKNSGVSEALNNCLKVDFWDVDEMANKTISLLRYNSLHKTLSDEGKREVDLFSWNRVADQTINTYKEVIKL